MILAIDTSTVHLSLALHDGAEILGENTWTDPNRHTAALAPAVRTMLDQTGTDEKKLKAIAVALGPGSFTSLRVGLSFAKGMALGLGIPIIGVPTLDIIAAQQPLCELPLCAFLQAGRAKYAVQAYRNVKEQWTPEGEIGVFTVDSLCESITEPTLMAGEFNADLRTAIRKQNKLIKFAPPTTCLRRAGMLAELAKKLLDKGQVPPVASLAPIYLRTNP